jgi:hypothetical protein
MDSICLCSYGLTVSQTAFQAIDAGSTSGERAVWVIVLPSEVSFCTEPLLLVAPNPFKAVS